MAPADRHLGLRLVFMTEVAVTLAGTILFLVINFQPGPAAMTYGPLGDNRWKDLAGLAVLAWVLGAITALVTGVVRRRVAHSEKDRDAAQIGQWVCGVAVVCCFIAAILFSGEVTDKEATMPVTATITSCSTPDPDNPVYNCSYRYEVAGYQYSESAQTTSLGSAGQRVVIDVDPDAPGVINPSPGAGESFLGLDLWVGLAGGLVIAIVAVGWIVLEVDAWRDRARPVR